MVPEAGMDKDEAEILARYYMDLYGLLDWEFRFNKNKNMLGLCRYDDMLIEMSEGYVLHNNVAHVTDTILHEVAHALAGRGTGHGPRWKVVAARVGATPQACSKDAILPQGKWQARCPVCARVFHFHRKPKYIRSRYCLQCGPEQGKLSFKDTKQAAAQKARAPVAGGGRKKRGPAVLSSSAGDYFEEEEFDPAIVFPGQAEDDAVTVVQQLVIDFPV